MGYAIIGFTVFVIIWAMVIIPNESEARKEAFIALMGATIPDKVIKEAARINPSLQSPEVMLSAVRGFKEFMGLFVLDPNTKFGMPSRAIDDVWHAFLNFPSDYSDFCLKYVGKVVSHVPFEKDETPRGLEVIPSNYAVSRLVYNTKKCIDNNRLLFSNIGTTPLIFAMDMAYGLEEGWAYSSAAYNSLKYSSASSNSTGGGCSGAAPAASSSDGCGCGGGCGGGGCGC